MYELEIIRETGKLQAAFRSLREETAASRHREGGTAPMRGYGRIIRMLSEQGRMTQNELADRLEIRPQSLTVAMSRLEEKGYISRTRDSVDRRKIIVEITDAGREHEKQIHSERANSAAGLLSGLTCEEKETLYRLLQKANGRGKEKC